MGEAKVGIGIEAKDKTSKVTNKITRGLDSSFKLIQKGAKGATKVLKNMGKKGIKAFRDLKSSVVSLQGAVVGLLGIAGMAGLVASFKKITQFAGVQEKAMVDLTAAFRATGTEGAAEATKEFSKFADEIQRTTTFGDEAVLQAASMAVRLGTTAKQLKQVTRISIGMSAAFGKGLAGSMKIVARAAAGDTAALKSFNIVIDQTLPKAQRVELAMKILQERFGSAAQAEVQTYGGRLIQSSNAFGDLLEQLGFVFTKSKLINAIIVEATKLWAQMGGVVEKNREFMQSLVNKGIRFVFVAFEKVIGVIGRVIVTFNLLKAAAFKVVSFILKTVKLVVGHYNRLISDFIAGINIIRKVLGKDPITNPLEAGFARVTQQLDNMIMASGDMTKEFVANAVRVSQGTDSLIAKWGKFTAGIEETAKTIQVATPEMAANIGKLGEGLQAGLVDKMKAVKLETASLTNDIGMQFADMFSKMVADGDISTKKIGQALTNLTKNIMTDLIKEQTQAVIKAGLVRLGVHAAEGAGAAAKSGIESGLPFPANLIAAGTAAGLMFTMISGFKGKFEHGGVVGKNVGGSQLPISGADKVPVLAQNGEAFLPVGITNALRGILGVRGSAPSRTSFQKGGVVDGGQGIGKVIKVEVNQSVVGFPGRAESRVWIRDVLAPELNDLMASGIA